ncbi:UDP-glucose:glycoprotein glucosyltransferase 1-like isoform X2 [Tubulanus polymorphus]|uniref:UDP-glucose:glycoprotein glucosyltransferase 1-like isoform X2 n=1 Tax=Tubulanus polymorphus TaxID=672921 RepID=UPI003DA5C9A2
MALCRLVVSVFVIVLISVRTAAEAKNKYVSISLNSQWSATPILAEASEYIAKGGNAYFWQFVDAVCEHSEQSVFGENDQEHYNFILKIADKFLSPQQLKIFRFSLALRAQSPTIEMYNQVAETVAPSNCDTFIEVQGKTSCNVNDVEKLVQSSADRPASMILKVDHRYPSADDEDVVVVLYGQIGTDSFKTFHRRIKSLADDGKVDYIVRHYVQYRGNEKVRLSGYGVGLDIKNQEYKAKDDTKVEDSHDAGETVEKEDEVQGFIFSKLEKLHPDLSGNLDEFRKHLIESGNEIVPLKVWEIQDLSFQAAQRILSSPKDQSLETMRAISQNFPTQAKNLAKVSVKDDVRSEIKLNQQLFENYLGIGAGDAAMFLNGMTIDLDVHDPFALLEILQSETKLLTGLHQLGIEEAQISEFMKIDMKTSDESYAVDIRSPHVVYINDLETERKYSGWPRSLNDMLRPTFPGMLRHVAKNIFHLVFVGDPVAKESRDILKLAEAFYVHSAPIRIGFVWVVNDGDDVDVKKDADVAMYRAFKYISENSTPYKALSFITDIFNSEEDDLPKSDAILDELESNFGASAVSQITDKNSKYDAGRKEAAEFFKKLGLGNVPQVLLNGAPLKKEEVTGDSFEEAVVNAIMQRTPEIQKAIYNRELTDNQDVLDWLMSRENVMPRLNPRVLSTDVDYVDFTQTADAGHVDRLDEFKKLKLDEMTGAVTSGMNYLTKKDEIIARSITNWIVGDFDSPAGRQLLYSAIKQMKTSNDVRVGVVHNPTHVPTDEKSTLISRAIQTAIATLPTGLARSFITKLVKEENVDGLLSGTKTISDLEVHGMDMEKYEKGFKSKATDFLFTHRMFCDQVLELQPGDRTVITNGRNIGALADGEEFTQEDFTLLQKVSSKGAKSKLQFKINWLGVSDSQISDLMMKISSLLLGNPQIESRRKLPPLSGQNSMIHLPAMDSGPAHELVVILDPLTRDAQKVSHVLMVLQKVVNTDIRIYMNTKEKHSELPLKNFYRFVLDSELQFKADKSMSPGPIARFDSLPHKPLFTLGLLAPHSWLVQSKRSVYDLDNIYLEEITNGVTAEFELESLLLEGHCYDTTTGAPPRGLQFTLGTKDTPVMVDTIVMANLGYFQLKAKPGAWLLRLREGRSQDIYDIASHEFTDSPADSADVVAVIDSFKSKIIKVKVSKKPGKLKEDVLQTDSTEDEGLWDSLSRWVPENIQRWVWSRFSGKTKETKTEDKDQTLNIFSVASGHLYERFLRIMMLGVLKNTKSKVKFWFIKNYLSPSVKDFIPHMAKEYGFEFEFVTYKWPRWLHQQTEKQRIIWGYKILFLDVLFPLDVKKIIYVDADQIVRADLQELYDLDLEGAPYAYTPFCDSRTEMDGFRFWKHGYWANHLGHRKYHISALYVVDLQKFRRVAAGDRLRGQYQGLSQDPNSLSNLDQDLPNNMIHQVAIKSLPQEWLWCETWCSDTEKPQAKTIDLCNNPQTKEPKLAAAMRIAPEWKNYDAEIKQLWEKIYNNKKIDKTSSTSSSQRKTTTKADGHKQHTEL